MLNRPFDNYRTAISDPDSFTGRVDLLKVFRDHPNWVHVLLGGRRIGKTSMLRAVEWSMFELPPNGGGSPLPVFVNLQAHQPKSADQFRSLLISKVWSTMNRYLVASEQYKLLDWRSRYRRFVDQIEEVRFEAAGPKIKSRVSNHELSPDYFGDEIQCCLKRLHEYGFVGILFLLDEAEFVTCREWSDDALGHIRGFKDTDPLRSLVGFVISGFRGLLDYQQRAGSALKNIAQLTWMDCLRCDETRSLVAQRFCKEPVAEWDNDDQFLWQYSGGHPFILQQMINKVIDERSCGRPVLIRQLQAEHDEIFHSWWNVVGNTDGLTERERTIYRLLPSNCRISFEELCGQSKVGEIALQKSLQLLCSSGLVRERKPEHPEHYEISCRLFWEWMMAQ